MADVQRAAHRGRRRVDGVDVLARLGAVEGVGLVGLPALGPLRLETLEGRLVGYDDGARGRRRLRCLVLLGLGHRGNPRVGRPMRENWFRVSPAPIAFPCIAHQTVSPSARTTEERGRCCPPLDETPSRTRGRGAICSAFDDVADAIRDFGSRYLDRVYTPVEQEAYRTGGAASLAARFAAKEAVLKLIGTADGVDPRSVEIANPGRPPRRPPVRPGGRAGRRRLTWAPSTSA